jgi:hypothetical protein
VEGEPLLGERMKKLSLLFVLISMLGAFSMSKADASSPSNPSNSSYDKCYERLSDNYSSDSRHFKVNMDDLDFEDESEIERAALNFLLKKKGCDLNKVQNFKCRHVSEFEYSFVCSANIDEGYFFIAPDMLNAVNIIFNRFD